MSGILRAEWPVPPRVHALTTTRDAAFGASGGAWARFNLGDHVGDDPAAVAANRKALRGAAALPAEPRWLRQVHGTAVQLFDTADAEGPAPIADAAVTARAGVVLAILTADCLPLLLCADDGAELAAVHAGWRGMAAGVIEAALARLATPPARVVAWLGPAIGPRAYEVGAEVRAAFVDGDAGAESAFAPTRPGHWGCDLYALARLRLARSGVVRVHGGGLCTSADAARFFSHRRDGVSGRMASLIWRDDA